MEAETGLDAELIERLNSKNWKDRQEAYSILGSLWSEGRMPDPEVVEKLQSEGNIPALEAAIDALLNVNGLRANDVKKIFGNIGNQKTSIRTRIDALIERLEDTEEVLEVLSELLGSKSPKNVAGALSAICGIVKKRGCDLKAIGGRIEEIMSHTDKNVRGEGFRLCIELYKRNGESVLPYLNGLKPIQQKELMEEFEKCSPVVEEESKKELECLPEDFLRGASDDNWKIRLEAMRNIKRVARTLEYNNELNVLLCRRIGDVNNQVFYVTLEVIDELRPKSMEIVKGLIERLKEKRGTTSEKIKEVLFSLGVKISGSNADFLGHKNPQVRLNLLDYSLRDLQNDKEFIKMIGNCILDPVGDVRNKAIDVATEIYKRHGNVFDGVVSQNALTRINKVVGKICKKEVAPTTPSSLQEKAIPGRKTKPDDIDIKERKDSKEKKAIPPAFQKDCSKDVEQRAKEDDIGSKRKHSHTNIDILLNNVSRQRVKGNMSREEVFTPQFIQMMDNGPFHQVYDLFDSIDKTIVSDFLIDFLIQSNASEAFINSTLLSFISNKYILKEFECRKLVEYLLSNDMVEELGMMDRVYPVTKLFLVYQRIGSKKSNDEILKLVKKYKMFRGDKKQFIEGIKKGGKVEVEEVIKGCPDFLSFVDELEGSFMSITEDECESAKIEKDSRERLDVYASKKTEDVGGSVDREDMEASFVHNDSFVNGDADIEASFDALSIHSVSGVFTPNSKKIRKEVVLPERQKKEISGLELILDHLIDSNPGVSEVAFKRLVNIIDSEIESLLSFSNSIVSSISIQLFDVLYNPSFSELILQVFFKLSQSELFCGQLRKETLLSANMDLIKIMKKQNDKVNSGKISSAETLVQDTSLIGEILINLCLNSKASLILEVYLEMLISSKEEILLKLIWRHSKALKMDDKEELSKVLDVLMRFYDNHYNSILSEDNVTLKILQLHLKEMVKFYRKDIYKFGIRGLARVFVGSMFGGTESIHHHEIKKIDTS
ncbi:hypothetical protein EROM_111790 [Encephalitozoon romaleae SJ-2008]|uniref:TOG domain-containing protein n=1 Tax=Encephalitozoon romaleae (strain SJ-2008) TaxID=1178016 RepID=I7AH97_ENCRO|nr:hypothetical protein EROM_111790 [Encephalitozoon romaleae SJ-2008]AFN84160.1 hypothetical protein EROM_111790 [Encephalitozoon romaleae SJ-2008]